MNAFNTCATPVSRVFARMVLLAAGVVLVVACATPTVLSSGEPKVVRGQDIHAYEVHEDCLRLAVGDRLDYEFASNQPVDFNIHYHEGRSVLMPIVRNKARQDSGLFAPVLAQDYCLMWEAGADGALLDYRIVVRRSDKR
jgi:hypothetical protein